MSLNRSRPARASWVALCLTACAQAGLVWTAYGQQPLRFDLLKLPIPVDASDDVDAGVITVAGGEAADVRKVLRVEVNETGASSKDELARAVQRLPFDKLSAADRQRVQPLVRAPSLYRRLPTITCRTDPRVYSFFVDNPDVAVSIWRVMGVSEMQMRQTGANEYETDLKDGTLGELTVLHRSPHCQLVLCSGDFKSPLLTKPIQSTGLMCLQSRTWQGRDGTNYVTHSGDVFVVFHSEAVEAIAKMISPMSFKMADRNFEEVTLFVRMMDEAMMRQPGWVEHVASKIDGVIAGRDKELLAVAAKVYVDARKRELQQNGVPVTLDAIRPPVQTADRK